MVNKLIVPLPPDNKRFSIKLILRNPALTPGKF